MTDNLQTKGFDQRKKMLSMQKQTIWNIHRHMEDKKLDGCLQQLCKKIKVNLISALKKLI